MPAPRLRPSSRLRSLILELLPVDSRACQNHSYVLAVALACSALHGPDSADAAVLRVPEDYPSIQDGIDASRVGDEILVGPGVYLENVEMASGRWLHSSMGPLQTIIDGRAMGSVISCVNLGGTTIIEGFTLRNGRAELGGGLHVFGSSIEFRGNIVTANTNTGVAYGAGVYTQECPATNLIEGNLIFENNGNIGGGVCCNGDDRSRIVGNTIWGNTANYASGIISYNYSDILVERNIIANNDGGTGMWTHSNSNTTILCNDIWANTPENYHGPD
ncbi:MAG: right-handed parallel beta-helix repeat-containing protein, partial [Candidatus Eisenbacteria bacterium]|nr:right-handed parallel beta-helix repeat-containing protein [Candidatus Eisenbacteria bacterium]